MKNNKTFNKLKFIIFSFLIFIVNMNVSYAETDDGVKLCQGILGEDLTALLKDALRLMQIAGPILVIIMTIIDLIKDDRNVKAKDIINKITHLKSKDNIKPKAAIKINNRHIPKRRGITNTRYKAKTYD